MIEAEAVGEHEGTVVIAVVVEVIVGDGGLGRDGDEGRVRFDERGGGEEAGL